MAKRVKRAKENQNFTFKFSHLSTLMSRLILKFLQNLEREGVEKINKKQQLNSMKPRGERAINFVFNDCKIGVQDNIEIKQWTANIMFEVYAENWRG